MPSLRLFTVALSLSAQSAYSFAPQTLNVRTQPRAAVALHRPSARVARPLRTVSVFATASLPAARAPSVPMSLTRSVVFRLATALLCTMATLLFTATCALAAATKTAAVSAGPLITGDMLKWGGVGLLAVGVFLRGGGKNTANSGFEFVEEEDAGFAAHAGSLQARPVDATTPLDESKPFDAVSDSAFSSALGARMQQLAQDKQEPAEDAEKPDDSTDEWGTGSTAVLEPPRPDAPTVDKGTVENFPVGFPLRDFDEEDVAPAASADDIAMLQRMFSTSKDGSD